MKKFRQFYLDHHESEYRRDEGHVYSVYNASINKEYLGKLFERPNKKWQIALPDGVVRANKYPKRLLALEMLRYHYEKSV